MISGTTRLIGLVGHPIVQVRMPSILNPYFEQSGQDLVMVPFDVLPAGVAAFVDTLRASPNILGTVVTVPHKQEMATRIDHLSDRARAIGAVNVVRREADGSLHGDHVDGFGFLNAARAHGFTSSGKTALVVGAGGAGSAIAYALCETGIRRLFVIDVDSQRSQRLVDVLKTSFPAVDLQTACPTLGGLDLLVNVTPVGMREGDPVPVPAALLETLTAATLVCDAITVPQVTPLLEFARGRGCVIQTGVEMSASSMEFLGSFLRCMPQVDPLTVVTAPLP